MEFFHRSLVHALAANSMLCFRLMWVAIFSWNFFIVGMSSRHLFFKYITGILFECHLEVAVFPLHFAHATSVPKKLDLPLWSTWPLDSYMIYLLLEVHQFCGIESKSLCVASDIYCWVLYRPFDNLHWPISSFSWLDIQWRGFPNKPTTHSMILVIL